MFVSLCFLPDCGSDTTVPCTLYAQTVVCTVVLWSFSSFEMAPSDFPDLFKSIMCFFRSVLSSLDFPIVMLVAESHWCIKQALLKDVISCYQSESHRRSKEVMLQSKFDETFKNNQN